MSKSEQQSNMSLCASTENSFGDFLWPWSTYSVGIIFPPNLLFYWNVIQKYFLSFFFKFDCVKADRKRWNCVTAGF